MNFTTKGGSRAPTGGPGTYEGFLSTESSHINKLFGTVMSGIYQIQQPYF